MANYKKFITFFMIFSIFMIPINSNASNLGGWTITNQIAQGSSLAIEATKNILINGSNVIQNSSAKIKPTVSAVSKVLARGAAAYALSVAVEQLIGSVDWVLDPANNQILYTKPLDPNQRYVYTFQGVAYTGADAACNAYFSQLSAIKLENKKVQLNNGGASVTCSATRTYSCYNGTQQCTTGVSYEIYRTAIIDGPAEEQKSLPLDVVAAQVISNADTHADHDKKVGAQAATTQAAQDMLANDLATQSDTETQLNTNATTQTSEEAAAEATPKNPAAPEAGTDIKITFPVFCSWAPSVCQAANVVINFPITLTDWWNRSTTALTEAYTFAKTKVQEFSDIFKDEPQTDTELEFNDPTDDITDTSVSFSSSCPQPIVLADFNFHGIPIHWELDFTAWCDSLSTYLKPIVISMASFSAVLILGGVRENG